MQSSAINFDLTGKSLTVNIDAIADNGDAAALLQVVFDIFRINPQRNIRLLKLYDYLSSDELKISKLRHLTFDQKLSVIVAICGKWDDDMTGWMTAFSNLSVLLSQLKLNWGSSQVVGFLATDAIAEQGLTLENIKSLIDLIIESEKSPETEQCQSQGASITS